LRVWREVILRAQPQPPHNCKMLRVQPKVLETRKEGEETQLPASWQVLYCTKSLYYVQSTSDHDTVGTSHPLSGAQLSLLILSGQLHSKSSMEAPANVSHKACPRAQHSRASPQMIGGASRNVRAEWSEVPHHLPWLQRRMWRRSHYAFWKRPRPSQFRS
jgi:hypothetical protein